MKRTTTAPARSRTGCERCKSKHMKCDEQRPECQMCLTSGVRCPGFEKTLKWSTKHERLHKRPRTEPNDTSTSAGAADTAPPPPNADVASVFGPPSTASLQTVDTSPSAAAIPSHSNTPWSGDMLALLGSEPSWADFPLTADDSYNWLSYTDFGLTGPTSVPPFDMNHGEAASLLPPPEGPQKTRDGADTANPNAENITLPPGGFAATPTSVTTNDSFTNVTKDASQQTGTARFLQTYYRSTPAAQMTGYSDNDLVQHYFKNVCPLFSCFDSSLNLFRSLPAERWTSSPTTFLSIQSMALGHLANDYPSLASLGMRRRSQAWKSLQRDLHLHRLGKVQTGHVLLNLMLLGVSSSWHEGTSLGMPYLLIARRLVQHQIERGSDGDSMEFFQKALMYWEMLVSFIDPLPILPLPGKLQMPVPPAMPDSIMPHPWAGVVVEVHFALAEVGRVLRRQCSSARGAPGGTKSMEPTEEKWATSFDVDWASRLEIFLHALQIPAMEQIQDFHDKKTSADDMVRAAVAYRFVGLLEIYRFYPHLLQARVVSSTELDGFKFDSLSAYSTIQMRLLEISKHALECVKLIKITSGVSRLLSLVYVIIASHLRSSSTGSEDSTSSETQSDDVLQLRPLIESKMLEMSRKYPQKPQLLMLDIIREVWNRLDDANPDSHWIDVMHQKGWQTLMD